MFEEGASVSLGDPLYRIDPATYEARVAAARAAVAQAQATYDAALKEADRANRLQGRGVVSDQTLETSVANRDTAAAGLQVAQAQLLQANIDLDRTTIRAQLSGVIGRSLTTQGALVTAGQMAALATIRTLDPVLVDVTQSAAEVIEFRRGETQARLRDADLTVKLTLADGNGYDETGQLTAAEPYVDEQTGVVTLRLEFPNKDHLLLPGMYVQVEMPQGVAKDVVLAPQEGVTRDRRGRPIAYVVNPQNVVEQRELTVAGARGSDWIVTDGLGEGDRMVVAGLQKIAPGAPVQPQERDANPQPPVEELSAPTADARATRAGKQADVGITVPGAGEDAPPPAESVTDAGGAAPPSGEAASSAEAAGSDEAEAEPQAVPAGAAGASEVRPASSAGTAAATTDDTAGTRSRPRRRRGDGGRTSAASQEAQAAQVGGGSSSAN